MSGHGFALSNLPTPKKKRLFEWIPNRKGSFRFRSLTTFFTIQFKILTLSLIFVRSRDGIIFNVVSIGLNFHFYKRRYSYLLFLLTRSMSSVPQQGIFTTISTLSFVLILHRSSFLPLCRKVCPTCRRRFRDFTRLELIIFPELFPV